MLKEDIEYVDSWANCFPKASIAKIMQGLIEGIAVNSNKDPEDICKVYPRLIVTARGDIAKVDKQFNMCPFEFSFDDGETWQWDKDDPEHKPHHKGRMMSQYREAWALDIYDMRKVVTEQGLKLAAEYNITKEEIKALHKKHGWDDDAMYKELLANRPDLWDEYHDTKYAKVQDMAFKEIRAAFCPHFDTGYNWMDYPEKAGFPEIPNRENRPWDWKYIEEE